MNLIYTCVFHQENYINLLKLLISSLVERGNLNHLTTEILIITSASFKSIIQRELSCFNLPINYYILELNTLFEANCARLNIFNYENINNYDKILFLDNDVLINNDVNILFDIEIKNKLYALEEGYIGHEIWGAQFFDFSQCDINQSAFTTGILYFRNEPTVKNLFETINLHIIDYIHKNNNTVPVCLEQPFIVYNAITTNSFDNTLMKSYCKSNPNSVSNEIIIYQFTDGECNYSSKYKKMSKFIGNISLFWEMKDNISFITLTNSGYIKYTLNCLESIKNINLNIPLHCYCIGKKGYETLLNKGYKCSLINDEENSNFATYKNGNWSKITFNKFKIIHENLLKYKYVCYTDSDVVYENNEFFGYLVEKIGDYEMLTQNNCEGVNSVSTGFMFIRSTENTLALFNPSYIESTCHMSNDYDINDYLENIKHKIHYKLLPVSLFPYGNYYYNNHFNISPYLIHFNWLVGDEKKEKMISFGKWYNKISICHNGSGSFANQLEGMLRLISHSLNNKAEYQYNYRKTFTFEENNITDKQKLEEYLVTGLNFLSKNIINTNDNVVYNEIYNDTRIYNTINYVDECIQKIYLYDGISYENELPSNFENNNEIMKSLPTLRDAFVFNNPFLPRPSYDNTKINVCCHIRLNDALGRRISDNENLCDIVKYFQKYNKYNVIIYSDDNIEFLKSENTFISDTKTNVLQSLSDFVHADIFLMNYSSLSIASHLLAKPTQKVFCPNEASIKFYSRILNKCIKAKEFNTVFPQN